MRALLVEKNMQVEGLKYMKAMVLQFINTFTGIGTSHIRKLVQTSFHHHKENSQEDHGPLLHMITM